jgi:hypothetical protein
VAGPVGSGAGRAREGSRGEATGASDDVEPVCDRDRGRCGHRVCGVPHGWDRAPSARDLRSFAFALAVILCADVLGLARNGVEGRVRSTASSREVLRQGLRSLTRWEQWGRLLATVAIVAVGWVMGWDSLLPFVAGLVASLLLLFAGLTTWWLLVEYDRQLARYAHEEQRPLDWGTSRVPDGGLDHAADAGKQRHEGGR